jgi:phytoene dehydrogenase-like protein
MALHTANIIGSGPNGLAAAITLAQHGVEVTVYERNAQPGGACSTAEVTLAGFHHDLGSSVYPLGIASPFFRALPLDNFDLRWIEPDAPLAHPFDDGTAILQEHSLDATAAQFEPNDSSAWKSLYAPSIRDWHKLVADLMQPMLRLPDHPIAMSFFGMPGILPAQTLARSIFRSERARTFFAGFAAHSVLPLTHVASAATGLVLATAGHTTGWPIVAGGAQGLTGALTAYLESLGGKILLNQEVRSLRDISPVDATFFDTSVSTLARIAGDELSSSFRTRLAHFKSGPGIFKMDYALSQPIPWRAPECTRAATVHLGGSLAEIACSERDAFYGRHCDKPFVLLVQPSLFDPTRAPEGKHTAWAYCHVPSGSTHDYTPAIEAQIERFAPGFKDCVLARHASSPATLAEWNPNLAGGDISGGAMTFSQLLFRPTARGCRTSNADIFLCSSSAPPGGGVHGMCGHNAAIAALDSLQN